MTNLSLTPPSPLSAKEENHTIDNGTLNADNSLGCHPPDIKLTVIVTFICVVCIIGLVGNGTVIWLLGFCIKRSPSTTYILNLAVADFGVLISVISLAISLLLVNYCIFAIVLFVVDIVLFHFMFSVSQFLLTIISVDRCVSVLFPIWYRCHRPEQLSTMLCTLIWIFCFLVHGICYTVWFFEEKLIFLYMFFVNAVICLPLITISSMILVIKFCFKTQQRQRKKLLMAILLALFFFLFLAFPLNVMYLKNLLSLSSYNDDDDVDDDDNDDISLQMLCAGYLCASVNSFVNPLIYFLVGRKKKGLCAENLKLILQRVFKQEEEVCGEELQLSVQTQVST